MKFSSGKQRIKIGIMCVAAASCLLTGCISYGAQEDMLSALSDNGVIPEDWKQIDFKSQSQSPIPAMYCYDYYYEDEGGNLYEVSIYATARKNEDGTKEYDITLTDYIESYETEEYVQTEGTDEYVLKNCTEYRQTDDSCGVKYTLQKKKSGYVLMESEE